MKGRTVPKLKYNVKDIESRSFEDPGAGVFRAKISEFVDEKPAGKDRRLVVKVKLLEPKKSVGFGLWSYITLEGRVGGPLVPKPEVDWKLRQLIDALQLGETGAFDTDNPQKLPEIRVRTRMEPYEGDMRAKLAAFLPGSVVIAEAEEDVEDDTDVEDEDTDEEAAEYSDMDDDELQAELEDRELDVPMTGKGRRAKLDRDRAIELLEEDDESGDDDTDEDDEDDDTEDDTEDEEEDYNTWTLDELKAEIAERGIDLPKPARGKKAPTKAQLVKAIEADDASDPV